MKVLFISSRYFTNGVSPFVLSQSESLVAKGLDVDFFTIESNGIKGYIKAIINLRKYLKEKKYDILHAHYAFCGWVATLAFSSTPVVVSFMGSDVLGGSSVKGKRINVLNIILTKLLQPFVKQIIVKSKNLEKHVFLKKKTYIIPNGVNFKKFKPMDKKECREKLNLPHDEKLILFLGNPDDPKKNITLLKKALMLFPNKKYNLLSPFPIKHEAVPFYMNAVDVIILMSFTEGSPNIVKEAMACNCPVVATDVGDIREVIGLTKGCGIVTFNPADVAEKIKNAMIFGKKTNGRADIVHLDERIIADKIISLYRKML